MVRSRTPVPREVQRMTIPTQEDSYPDDEAQRRFEAIVRGAGKAPPKPLKAVPRRRPKAKGR